MYREIAIKQIGRQVGRQRPCGNQKSIIDTQEKKERYPNNTKASHQITMRKKRMEPKKTYKINEKYGCKDINVNNYFKCKWTKCSNQKTEWLNGYQK